MELHNRKLGALIVSAIACISCSNAALARAVPSATCAQSIAEAGSAKSDDFLFKNVANLNYLDGAKLHTPEAFYSALKSIDAASIANEKQSVVVIDGGNFGGWDFRDIHPFSAPICFYRSVLTGSNWEGVSFPQIGFFDTDLTGAKFRTARIPGVTFHNAILRDVDMRKAWLTNGRFSGGWGGNVTNWDLTEATMKGFRFDCGITINDGCPLERRGINFSAADLTEADISSLLTWDSADFSNTIFKSTTIAPQQVKHLVGIIPKGPIILRGGDERSYLTGSEFKQLHALAKIYAEEISEPSFQCFNARSAVENLICGQYAAKLRALDRQMKELYTNGWPHFPGNLPSQREWLKERDKCTDADCVEAAYQTRISAVLAAAGDPGFLKPGESAYYIPNIIGLPESIIASRLYQRIVPAIAGEARAAIRIIRELDGSYSAIGTAVGANAHTCSLRGTAVAFDNQNGWFSGIDDEGESWPIFQVVGDELTVFDNGKSDASRPMSSFSYVSCGARASFQTMQRLNYDSKKLAAILTFPDE